MWTYVYLVCRKKNKSSKPINENYPLTASATSLTSARHKLADCARSCSGAKWRNSIAMYNVSTYHSSSVATFHRAPRATTVSETLMQHAVHNPLHMVSKLDLSEKGTRTRREQWHRLAPGEASVSAPQPDTSWPTALDPVRVTLLRYVHYI